jgi:hypothetical protein
MREKVWKRFRSCGFVREKACRRLTTDEESRPPLNSRPMGQWLRNRHCTALLKSSKIRGHSRLIRIFTRLDRSSMRRVSTDLGERRDRSRFKSGDSLEGFNGDDGSAQERRSSLHWDGGRMVFEQEEAL